MVVCVCPCPYARPYHFSVAAMSIVVNYASGMTAGHITHEETLHFGKVAEHLRKESAAGSKRAGTSLEFPGHIVHNQKFFVVSFPGIYEAAWKRMTEGMYALMLSCACVFFQDKDGRVNGQHACDERGCRCDRLAECAPDQARPQIGTTFTDWKGEEKKGDWDGNMPPWGCLWLLLWELNVLACLACKQKPVVVYQTDREFDGVTGTHMGLGNAQCGAGLRSVDGAGGGVLYYVDNTDTHTHARASTNSIADWSVHGCVKHLHTMYL